MINDCEEALRSVPVGDLGKYRFGELEEPGSAGRCAVTQLGVVVSQKPVWREIELADGDFLFEGPSDVPKALDWKNLLMISGPAIAKPNQVLDPGVLQAGDRVDRHGFP